MFLTPEDLVPFADIEHAKATAMIADIEALAITSVPGLLTVEDKTIKAAVKAILRAAVLRWEDAGTGALTQHSQTAGIYTESQSFDNRQGRKPLLWPSELDQLRGLVEAKATRLAGSIDTAPRARGGHIQWCDLYLGGDHCSCGADINAYVEPLYEGGILSPGSL